MQWRADRVAVRPFIDSRRDGDASGMPDPEMCVSGRDFSCLSGMLDDEKIKQKTIRKASLYSSTGSASHLQMTICKPDVNITLQTIIRKWFSLLKRKKAVLFSEKNGF